MRLPRVRLTLRRMMLSVVAVAILLAGEATRRRWESLAAAYRKKADGYERAAFVASHGSDLEAVRGDDARRRGLRRVADQYLALAKKYREAARRPQFPVAPDPPEP